MPIESGTEFLKGKYDLHNAPEVQSAADRTNKRNELHAEEGEDLEAVGQDPESQIKNYIDRFTEITEREDPAKREHGLEALKRLLHSRFVIKPDQIPDSYWEAQIRQSREAGAGEIEINDEMRQRETSRVVADQEESLDRWIDYLASPDAHYPDYLKYYTVRSVLSMGNFDPDRHTFTERTDHTVKRFPTLSRGALGRTLDSIERYFGSGFFASKEELGQAQQRVKEAKNSLSYAEKQQKSDLSVENEELAAARAEVASINQKLEDLINGQIDDNPNQPKFPRALMSADFATLYAIQLEKSGSAKQELWPVTEGRWVTYSKGQENELVAKITPYGTDWCLEGTATATEYLGKGELLVYFSEDEQGEPKIPRAGVFVVEGKIKEVHGVGEQQNLDPYIADVMREKMQNLGDLAYEKRAHDMQMVTYVERKVQGNHELTKDDLLFLYEINSPIQGFGYQRDPRIAELKSQRNPEEDMPIVFECESSQIARSVDEINERTKAFVGKLEPGIFTKIAESPNIEHLYTNFPEGRIDRSELTIGGKAIEELKNEMKERGINISNAEFMLDNTPVLKDLEVITTIRLKVGDLGFTRNPTTDEIYARAEELGLELCPAETGPHQRLKDLEQPLGDWYRIAMKQIADRGGNPDVFRLEHDGLGLWLDGHWARPDDEWGLDDQFVFRLRNVSRDTEASKPLPQFEI